MISAGKHEFEDTRWFSKREVQVEVVSISEPLSTSQASTVRRNEPLFARYFTEIASNSHEFKVVLVDGIMVRVLPPNYKLIFLQDAGVFEVLKYDLDESLEIADQYKNSIYKSFTSNPNLLNIDVPLSYKCLLFVDQKLVQELGCGNYLYLNCFTNITYSLISTINQILEIQNQELLTDDKVTIRINLTADYLLVNPTKVYEYYGEGYRAFIYKELQLRLRNAISDKTLNQVLEQKQLISESLKVAVDDSVENHHIHISNIAIKDIILPGEIRTIMNQVVEAEKKAAANVIKRREETAAT